MTPDMLAKVRDKFDNHMDICHMSGEGHIKFKYCIYNFLQPCILKCKVLTLKNVAF